MALATGLFAESLLRIRPDLGAAARNESELDEIRVCTELQDLHEQRRQGLQVPPTKLRDRTEVGGSSATISMKSDPSHTSQGDRVTAPQVSAVKILVDRHQCGHRKLILSAP
jgi:hypothetical protein